MKIWSLLPSATEIAYALGLGDEVIGVSFECDYPPEARQKPVIVHRKLPEDLSAAEIDRSVREFVARGESLYRIDAEALHRAQPDLILSQELCHVCAASPDDLAGALEGLSTAPKLVSLNPHTLGDVWNNIREVGCAAGRRKEASALAAHLEERIRAVQNLVASGIRPRVVCLEWLDPPYIAGHWLPEMVDVAGGLDALGHAGQPSFGTDWNTVIAAQPDVIIVMPCGYDLEGALAQYAAWNPPVGWDELPAVRNRSVFAVDASGCFSRPGPRLADGVETLAAIFHAGLVPAHWRDGHGHEGRAVRCADARGIQNATVIETAPLRSQD